MGAQDNSGGSGTGFGGNIVAQGPWWTAFGPGGVEGELPLLEGVYNSRSLYDCGLFLFALLETELGINFSHIRVKSMTVLNPLKQVDEHIMDDADMAGPILFCFSFATFLLLVGSISVCSNSSSSHLVWKGAIRVYLWRGSCRIRVHVLSAQRHVRIGD